MFQKTAKTTTNTGDYPTNVPKNGQNARADNALATKLALEVPRTSNLSEFPLRVAFARYALSASAGRRANTGEKTPANVPQNGNAQSRRRQTELKQSQTNLPCLRQSRRRQTELALEAGHRAHQSALPASIETQADRAFTESAPHFQF